MVKYNDEKQNHISSNK